jgi:glycosyltransferase domain-containing protein
LEESRGIFPNLDIEYIRYPDDDNFRRYFLKMSDAIQRVRTPYTMLADNDDFLVLGGIERSLDFLETRDDYVCCGGGIAGFSVYARDNASPTGLLGPLNRLAYRYAPYDRSIDLGSSSVANRLLLGLRNSWSYYAVFRSPALLTIWREAADMDLSDLQLHEKFCAMRTLTLGKARSDPASIGYMRQYWTSLRSAFSKDWVHHLLRNRFSTDFAEIIARISKEAAGNELDQEIIAENLRERIEPWLRDFLRLNYGLYGVTRQHIRSTAPAILDWLKMRRRYSVPLERRMLLGKLRTNGASEQYLKAFREELADIEDVIAGRAFKEFIQPYMRKFTSASISPPAARFDSFGRGRNV